MVQFIKTTDKIIPVGEITLIVPTNNNTAATIYLLHKYGVALNGQNGSKTVSVNLSLDKIADILQQDTPVAVLG